MKIGFVLLIQSHTLPYCKPTANPPQNPHKPTPAPTMENETQTGQLSRGNTILTLLPYSLHTTPFATDTPITDFIVSLTYGEKKKG